MPGDRQIVLFSYLMKVAEQLRDDRGLEEYWYAGTIICW